MAPPNILSQLSLFTKTDIPKRKRFQNYNEQYNSKDPPQPRQPDITKPSVALNMPHNGAPHAIGIRIGF